MQGDGQRWIHLDGRLVPSEEAVISVRDRAFLLGDGVFETVRLWNGELFRWRDHFQRLERGAKALRLALAPGCAALGNAIRQTAARNRLTEAVARVTLSRGVGTRGYSIREADEPRLVITCDPAPEVGERPESWRLRTSLFPIFSGDPLHQIKSCSRLVHVLARAEAEEDGADEALLLNEKGEVAETAAANIFWIRQRRVHTPPCTAGALAGITRRVIMELGRKRGLEMCETVAGPGEVLRADGVFLTMSTRGVVEVGALDGKRLKYSPISRRLAADYRAAASASRRTGR